MCLSAVGQEGLETGRGWRGGIGAVGGVGARQLCGNASVDICDTEASSMELEARTDDEHEVKCDDAVVDTL